MKSFSLSSETILSGKYRAILNISRTSRVALMELGSQSVETILCVCVQSFFRGASQSAVRRRWLSMYSEWPSHSQWPSEQISFIMTMRLPILQLSCRLFFLAKHRIIQVCQPPYSLDLVPGDFWLFRKLKSTLKGWRFMNATVTHYKISVNGVSLPTY